MTSKEKTDFRKTKEWKDFRLKIIEIRGADCECCGTEFSKSSQKSLHLHHIEPENYTLLVEENFALLCSVCHRSIIEKMIKKINSKKPKIRNIEHWKNLIWKFIDAKTKEKLLILLEKP